MRKGNIIVEANANFHHLGGQDLFKNDRPEFKEYRRKWTEWPAAFYHGPFPLFIDIEVTNNCNYRCKFCATTLFDSSVKRGFISFDTVRKVIDEGAANGLCGVKFNDRGEPLLHKDIASFVRYAKDAGLVDVYFNTNAMLLDEKRAQALIDSGLDRISISAEGFTKEVYEKYRIGGDFERVVENVSRLKELRDKSGSATPRIRVQTVLLPDVASSLDAYAEFWSRYADEVSYLDYKEECDTSLRSKDLAYPWGCHQLWQRMVVWWDGTILPCNEDDRGRLALGNISDTTIKAAWDSAAHERLRTLHMQGQSHKAEPCNGCYLRDSEIRKIQGRRKDSQ